MHDGTNVYEKKIKNFKKLLRPETENLHFDTILVLHAHFRFSCGEGVDGVSYTTLFYSRYVFWNRTLDVPMILNSSIPVVTRGNPLKIFPGAHFEKITVP